jgi:hypothetical protein
MYTHIYPAKVLYVHNPKYFQLKVAVWPNDLHFKTNLNIAVEDELWADWNDPDKKAEYIDVLVKSLRNKIVFVEVTAGDEVNPKPIANMYVPIETGNVTINSYPTLIYPHFLQQWKAGNLLHVVNLSSIYRM